MKTLHTPKLNPSSLLRVSLAILLWMASLTATLAQTPLTSGLAVTGDLLVKGKSDVWSFDLTSGDTFIIRAGEISVVGDLRPQIQVNDPNGVQVSKQAGLNSAEIVGKATQTGVYTVVVNSALTTGLGTYHLEYVRIPGGITIANNDEGGPIANGETKDGNLPVGDFDTYSFTAAAGDGIVVRAGENTVVGDLRPWVRLFGPTGILLGTDQGLSHAEVAVRATNSGPFTVVVTTSLDGGAGSYRLTLARSQGPVVVSAGDEGGSITNGQTVEASLPVGDLDVWTCNAKVGDNIVARMGEVSVVVDLRPSLLLYGPTGILLSQNQGLNHAEVATRATNNGVYTIVAGSAIDGGSGTYRLSLATTDGTTVISPGDEGGPIANGETKEADLPVGDLDVWTFTAAAGESIVARMGEVSVIGDLRPELRLYGPTGILLSQAQGLADAEVLTRATNSGVFTLVTSASIDGGAGRYRISLATSSGTVVTSPGDGGGPISNGELKRAALPVGDLDVWTFQASAGENIVARVGEVSVIGDLRPDVRLYGPNGALLARDQAVNDAEVSLRATNSGTFTIVIAAAIDGGAGEYQLTLATSSGNVVVSPGDQGGPILNGETKEGELTVGDLDVWTFTANAGDSLIVRMGENVVIGDLRPDVRLFGPTGILLARDQQINDAEVFLRATNSGTFTVVASAAIATGAGTYRLHLSRAPAALTVSDGDEGGAIANGATVHATFHIGDLDIWNFSAVAGDSVIIRAGEVKTDTDIRPTLRLFGPSGELVLRDDNLTVAEIATRLTATGVYQIVASAGIGGGSGQYQFHFVQVPGTFMVPSDDEGGLIAPGTEVRGNLKFGDIDPWVFTACQGELITIRGLPLVGSVNLFPKLRLYSRDGTLLATASGANGSVLQTRAPGTGNYTLVINDGNPGEIGFGPYLLDTGGLYAGTRLCVTKTTAAGEVHLELGGGTAGAEFVLLSSTDLFVPIGSWTPILTNHFGSFGEFAFTNRLRSGVDQEYFRFIQK